MSRVAVLIHGVLSQFVISSLTVMSLSVLDTRLPRLQGAWAQSKFTSNKFCYNFLSSYIFSKKI